jgi:outer membrane protein assembly factor BamB
MSLVLTAATARAQVRSPVVPPPGTRQPPITPPQTPAAPAAPPTSAVATLEPRWAATFDSVPAAIPAFDSHFAFLPLKGGPLVAIDLERGLPRWRLDLAIDSTPAVGDGLVFAAADGAIVAIESTSGAIQWRTPLPGALGAPLYWDTGWLIASTQGGELAALRANDGELVWRQAVGAPVSVTPVPANDALYVPLTDGRVVCVELASGTPRWEYKIDGRVTGLVVVDNQLIAGATSNQLVAINIHSGRFAQRWRVGADPVGAATADEKHIYFVALDNVLRAVDRRNGNLRWMQPVPSRPSGGPLLVDDVVLVPFVSTALAAFGAADGKPAFSISAAGELAGQPHLRANAPLTGARLITLSREGRLQGFGQQIEAPPVGLDALPGVKVGG